MSDLLAARSQMAMSLGFHIIFSIVGIGMPLLMVIAEALWLKTGQEIYLILAKRWAKGTAIMFAVGAVSGTVLSFELGLLWPKFMEHAGPIIGMPFSLEGFAFFLEAIFLGIYLYGWKKISPKAHWWSGFMVMVSGALSGVFVVTANGWMNTPTGFHINSITGKISHIEPITAMLNPSALSMTIHMTIAAFVSIGFIVAAIHAYMMLKDPSNQFHQKAFRIALVVGAVFALLQPLSGDLSAKHVARHQPVKLAAMEGHWESEVGASFRLFGWPDEKTETTSYSIEIPYLLSILAYGDPKAKVVGLKAFAKKDRPPVAIVHIAFQIMIFCGMAMLFVGLFTLLFYWRKKEIPTMKWFLKTVIFCGPMGFIATEAGWTVTEVGRQPWVVYNLMRTSEAVTPMPNLIIPFLSFTVLYFVLGLVVLSLLRYHVFMSPYIPVESKSDQPTSKSSSQKTASEELEQEKKENTSTP